MPEPGGAVFNADDFYSQGMRADLCKIATDHCYEHGTHIVDEILARYHVNPKTIKELKVS